MRQISLRRTIATLLAVLNDLELTYLNILFRTVALIGKQNN